MSKPPITRRHSRSAFSSAVARIVNKANNAIVRICSLFLIAAILTPLFFAAPVERAKASLTRNAPAPVAAPPEPFVIGEATSGSLAPATIAATLLTTLTALLPSSKMPEGIVVPNTPTFSQRVLSTFGPVLAFVSPSVKRATAAPPVAPAGAVTFDFDGDGKADVGRWHGTNTEFKIKNSNGGSYTTTTIGAAASKPAPGDFDDDNIFDAAVFNAATGTWNIDPSGGSPYSVSWGTSGDIPVVGDYDDDGNSDIAIWRPSTATWWISKSSGGYSATAFGNSTDIPVPGDYDADGQTDLALWRPSNGTWYVQLSAGGGIGSQFGSAGDTPLQGDFDGDGKDDLAVFRPSTGIWYVLSSASGYTSYTANTWGNYGDQPVPADYDSDGKADRAIWRPTTGEWYITKSGGGTDVHLLGVPGDIAIPSAFTKQVGGTATADEISQARLSPRNATGGTDLYSQNFGWGTTLVSLPGRSGLDAGLGIGYNSLVWTKVGSAMHFDTNYSNAGPGFTFGLPTIEPIYWNGTTSKWSYIMVSPSGARTEFRQTTVSNTYETADSSYSQIVTSGATNPNDPVEDIDITVKTTDGTQMTYDWIMGAYRCTQIKDRNGNYITAAYTFTGDIETVTDTLGRVITVNYDSGTGYPTTITQTWKDTNGSGSNVTHTWATLSYTTKAVDINFGSLAVVGPPDDTVLTVLDKITYADTSWTKFHYNGYLQVEKIENYADDDHKLNHVSTNLASVSGSQSDCPRFTETKTYAENFNSGSEVAVTNTAPAADSYSLPGSLAGSSLSVKVAVTSHPDQLYSLTHFAPAGSYKEGLTLATEDCTGTDSDCATRKRWTWTDWTQDNESATYILNPRVEETRVGDGTNTKKTAISYYEPTSGSFPYGLPVTVAVGDLSTVLKTQTTAYNLSSNYTDRRIIGLPSETKLYEGTTSGTPMSRVTFGYDEDGYSGAGQSVTATRHCASSSADCPSAYGTSFSHRGNRTTTRRWDVTVPTTEAASVRTSVKYNITGSPISQTDPRDRVTTVSYADSFNSTVSNATYAYPTTVTDPQGNSSTIEYRFDIGANIWARSPTPSGSGNTYGKTTSRTFSDTTGRIEKEKVENTGAYTRYTYATSGNAMTAYGTIIDVNSDTYIDSTDEVATETLFDGAGRVRMTRTANPNSTGGYSGKVVEYDILGRLKRETVPTEMNSSWGPAGDDYRSNTFLWNTREYDWKGRVTRSIPSDSTGSDGKDTLIEYTGCGCAGGQVTTVKGPVTTAIDAGGTSQTTKRRWQKSYEDILGRTYKTEIWDLDGAGSAPYSTVKTTLNGRDQATLVRQYSGADTSSTYQDTAITFDGHGRPATKHLPEYDSGENTSWTYNGDDSIATVTDPRDAVTTYTYGLPSASEKRAVVTGIAYSVPSESGIVDPSDVSFTYDNAGNRTFMSDGTGTLTYAYDELSRLTSETKDFADSLTNAPSGGVYTLGYSYHLTGGIKSITDPFGAVVSYASDSVGRTTAIGGSGFGSVTSFASNISYRAFGGVNALTYSTSTATNISLTYDNAMRLSTFEVASAANEDDVQNKAYAYNNDGSIDQVTNNVDSTFGQLYDYDFAGRLKLNQFGTGSASPGPYYKQTLGYDAFNHITSRSTWDKDSTQRSFTAGYTNNRKTSGGYGSGYDTHDVAGNVIYNHVSSSPPDWRSWKFDAAGRMTDWLETSTYVATTRWDQGEILTFDGDGRTAKRLKRSRIYASPPSAMTELPEYCIYSSVTGQKITDLDATGQKKQTNVYMGNTVIAEHTSGVVFKTTDPVTGSIMQSNLSGEIPPYDVGRVELEALGAVVPTQEPEIIEPPHNFGKGGSIGNPESGCTWDGAPIPCRMISSILSRGGERTLEINGRAEGGWSLSQSLQSQIRNWRYDVYSEPKTGSLDRTTVDGADGTIRVTTDRMLLGSFYVSYLSGFAENIINSLSQQQTQPTALAGGHAPLGPPPPKSKTLQRAIDLARQMLKNDDCNKAISWSGVQDARSAVATLDDNRGASATVDEQPTNPGKDWFGDGYSLAYTHFPSLTISFYMGFYEHADSLVDDDQGKPTQSTVSLIRDDLDLRQAWIVLHELSHATGRYIGHRGPTATSASTVNRRIYDACLKPWMQRNQGGQR